MRFEEKSKNLDHIRQQDDYIQKYINLKNKEYKNLEKEVNYYRGLLETKTLRQAGRYYKQVTPTNTQQTMNTHSPL